MKNDSYYDALNFAKILSDSKLIENVLHFGNFGLKVTNEIKDRIQYNKEELDLLNNKHEYSVKLMSFF